MVDGYWLPATGGNSAVLLKDGPEMTPFLREYRAFRVRRDQATGRRASWVGVVPTWEDGVSRAHGDAAIPVIQDAALGWR